MSEIVYTVSQGSLQDVSSFEIIDQKDGQLVDQTVIQNKFNTQTDKIEAHFYSLDGTLLQSFKDFTEFVIPRGKINKDQDLIQINLDPQQDIVRAGFTNGDVYVVYNFLKRLLTTENSTETNLFIEAISPDRTELRAILVKNSKKDSELITAASLLKERIEASEFIEQFVLNFTNNRLLIGLNIDTVRVSGVAGVVIKLYQPLPIDLQIKDFFTLEEIVSDSITFEVESQPIIEEVILPQLRGPNFDVLDTEGDKNPTEFLTLSDLLPYGSSAQTQALIQEKGIELGIDYNNFENFIFFSSAKERVANFLFKTDLITSASGDDVKIQNIINKFDHFERHLYFKEELQNENPQAYLQQAELYDELNFNKLTNSIPSYILEDSRNLPYLLFVDMVAQHFDNIWIYINGITDRYKADNRLDFGISKDLVREAVENLGINLYRSNKSVESLFSVFDGETYVSGSEVLTLPVKQFSEPLQPVSKNDYLKEIYKRVYHNIPLLLKSKGTERGLRSLINCFGIPDNLLDIKVYENTPLSFNRPNQVLDYTTSSLDRIRLQTTGSILEDNILSTDTRIQTYDVIYDENLSTVEVGFSPTDYVNNFISGSQSVQSIDNLIGDPADYDKEAYTPIQIKATQVLGATKPYNVQEFIRLIKFYDNALFRVVQEFIPARTDIVSGVVIKPHILERSKRKGTTAKWVKFFTNKNPQVDVDFTGSDYGKNFQLEGTILTTETSGQASGAVPISFITSYNSNIALGTDSEQARFTGEFENSEIVVIDTEVSTRNKFKPTSNQTLFTDRFEGSDYDVIYNNIDRSTTSTNRKVLENLFLPEIIVIFSSPVISISEEAEFVTYLVDANDGTEELDSNTFSFNYLTEQSGALEEVTLTNKQRITICAIKDSITTTDPEIVITSIGECFEAEQASAPLISNYTNSNFFELKNVYTSNDPYVTLDDLNYINLDYCQTGSLSLWQGSGRYYLDSEGQEEVPIGRFYTIINSLGIPSLVISRQLIYNSTPKPTAFTCGGIRGSVLSLDNSPLVFFGFQNEQQRIDPFASIEQACSGSSSRSTIFYSNFQNLSINDAVIASSFSLLDEFESGYFRYNDRIIYLDKLQNIQNGTIYKVQGIYSCTPSDGTVGISPPILPPLTVLSPNTSFPGKTLYVAYSERP